MVDPKADELEITVGGRDFVIKQSPGVLQSNRGGGTTGATVWRASVHLAEWLGSSGNVLFETGNLSSESIVLELGSGISGLVPSVLGARVKRVVATDQQYALKLLQENVRTNSTVRKSKNRPTVDNIDALALDWETDDIFSFLSVHDLQNGVDALVVCDCIFNYALIAPLVEACTNICRAREQDAKGLEPDKGKPTICIIAQQLRQPDVFEQWLEEFLRAFRAWRGPGAVLSEDLKEGSGFAVHFAILR